MDEYKYPLFFEAKNLRDKERLRRYFQTRQESGGGDCGLIEETGNNTYKICFKEKEDQERVLQRSIHTIILPSGKLCLSVRQTSSTQVPIQMSTQTFTKTSTKGQEKIFKLNIYLIYFLRDNPKVYKILQQQLSAINCSVELDFEKEGVVVRGNIEEEPTGGLSTAEIWEIQVDQVFIGLTNSYVCHYVFDPKQIAILQQDVFVVTEDIKIYRENGYSVVVGEVGSVNEKIANLGKSLRVNKNIPDAEKNLKVDTVQIQGAAAVPPVLHRVKGILTKDSFIPGISGTAVTSVQLVGNSKNVNKLKEVPSDFPIQHTETQEQLDLPHPELIDCFDKLLDLIEGRNSSVTIKASSVPHPCFLLSGPGVLVQKTRINLTASLDSLISDTLVLDGSGAQRYFQEEGKMNKELVEGACKVIIMEHKQLSQKNSPIISSPSTNSLPPKPTQIPQMILEIKTGSLEDEQVNVLVVPMLNKTLTSTSIGKCVSGKAGEIITKKFDMMAAKCIVSPGDVLQVDGPPSLGCSKIFFIECLPWDGVRGQSVQALGKGLRRCLELCVQQGWSSVAFPVIGPGPVLKYPLKEAIEALTENIQQFGLSSSSGSLSTIHVVVKPDYANAEECYHVLYTRLSLAQQGQAIFRSITSDLDEITMTVGGGVKLQLVFGDITKETTEAIVNSTNFVHFDDVDGVCNDILAVAGPEIEAELKRAKKNHKRIFVTQAGSLPCKVILHVRGRRDPDVIKLLMFDIIDYCKKFGLTSVAIPAICAGAGGMDPGVVAEAIMQGIKNVVPSAPPFCLRNIRLVLIKINVFLAFKEVAMQMFPITINSRVSTHLPPTVLHHKQQEQPLYENIDLSVLHTSSTNQQSVFLFLGLSRESVTTAMTKLKDLYQAQCSTETFTKEQLEGLTPGDINDLQQFVETQGLYMQRDQSGQGSLTVNGLKNGVTQWMQKMNGFKQGSLKREVRFREEDDLYNRVTWCIQGHNGNWERLPKTASYELENNEIAGGIVDAKGIAWRVDLQTMEAKRRPTGEIGKLKRLENRPDFTLPLYWDNMTINETMKVVSLQSSSTEYQTVKEAFERTIPKTVIKIERVQNIHLRHAYEALKKQISDKNNLQGGAGEKLLYHGTSHDNCNSIMTTGFNRSFAGQNATSYGHGTYFAVNANYSANPTYSRPGADGSQLILVARVLTGTYTVGSSRMRMPPPRNNQQPHDRYDSLVNRMDNPNMFVVFHDSQAYPDYLITFR